jgi:hypothetical protein
MFLHTSFQSKFCTQSYGLSKSQESQFWKFRNSNLGVLGHNDIWVLASWPDIENIIRGKWWLPPNLGRGEFCESMFASDSSVHQKCSNYALINLLFGLCRSVWRIDLLITCSSPHPGAPTCLSTLEVLWTNERSPTPCPSIVFTFGLVVESIKEFWGALETAKLACGKSTSTKNPHDIASCHF